MEQTSKNVITYINDIPHLDVDGDEFAFPLEFEQDGTKTIAFFHMGAKVPAHEIRPVLDELLVRYKSTDLSDEREIVPGDDTVSHKLVDKYFRGISGLGGEYTLEEMKGWLDENAGKKGRIFREGYDQVLPGGADEPARKLLLVRSLETKIRTKRLLYSPERDRIEDVPVTHVFRKETKEDQLKYQRSVRITQQGRFSYVRYNWDVIMQLYEALIMRLDGAVIGSEKCTEANKSAWVPAVLLNDKVFAINKVFSRLAAKNA